MGVSSETADTKGTNEMTQRAYPTRAQYMAKEISHQDYYESIASLAGVSFKHGDMLPEIKQCLADGDEFLNRIPLKKWDYSGEWLATRPDYRAALKAHGEIDSKSVRVCVLKAAAREAAA